MLMRLEEWKELKRTALLFYKAIFDRYLTDIYGRLTNRSVPL